VTSGSYLLGSQSMALETKPELRSSDVTLRDATIPAFLRSLCNSDVTSRDFRFIFTWKSKNGARNEAGVT
jgi:hypothetical protein